MGDGSGLAIGVAGSISVAVEVAVGLAASAVRVVTGNDVTSMAVGVAVDSCTRAAVA
jgi:hypothetical protein